MDKDDQETREFQLRQFIETQETKALVRRNNEGQSFVSDSTWLQLTICINSWKCARLSGITERIKKTRIKIMELASEQLTL